MKRSLLFVAAALAIGPPATASAQFGRVMKEGLEALGKRAVGKTVREAAQEGGERVLKKALTEVGQESAESLAKRAGISAAHYTDEMAQVVGQHGGGVAAPIINAFGDDGAKALLKLSPDNARRMAILTDDLAKHGQGQEWMKLLAENGDAAAEWIWKNKGTIAVATTATAFLANPDPFLQAGESVVIQSIETAGEHIAQPLIEGTVEHVIPPLVHEIGHVVTAPMANVASSSVKHPGMMLMLVGGCGMIGFCVYRWHLFPWRMLWKQTLHS